MDHQFSHGLLIIVAGVRDVVRHSEHRERYRLDFL